MQNNTSKIIIVILALVIIVGGWLWYQDSKNPVDDSWKEYPLDTTPGGLEETSEAPLIPEVRVFSSPEAGFSFELSEKYPEVLTGAHPETGEKYSLVTPGETGKMLRGYLSYDPIFYIAGLSEDYSAGRGGDAGEIRDIEYVYTLASQYGWKTTISGDHYVYVKKTGVSDDYNGIDPSDTTYMAVFILPQDGPVPVLSFYAINVVEADFLEIVNSVNIVD